MQYISRVSPVVWDFAVMMPANPSLSGSKPAGMSLG